VTISVDDQVRERLLTVITVLQPYARSHGAFVNLPDLRVAIGLAEHALEKAELLVNHRLPQKR
jgi:hypothetical protein